MLKEVIVFNFKRGESHEKVNEWYFDRHVETTRRIPYLARYVGYRFIRLPENQFFHAPQYQLMEELWWPDRPAYEKAARSDQFKLASDDFNRPTGVVEAGESKRLFLEREINILCPEKTDRSYLAMNELNGTAHVKGIWPLNFHGSLDPDDADDWYISHHCRVAAQNLGFIKYVTWSPVRDMSPDADFKRYTEQWSRDWQTYLDGFQSPNGKIALDDNRMANGEWRIVTKSRFMEHPHVAGNLMVFL